MEEQKRLEQERRAARQAELEAQRKEEMKRKAEEQRKQEQARIANNKKPPAADNKYSFEGKAQTGELLDFSGAGKKMRDTMYEGGSLFEGGDEGEEPVADVTADKLIDQEKGKSDAVAEAGDMIDLDEAMEREDGFKMIATHKLHRVTDWKIMHEDSWFSALLAGELRSNDAKIMISWFLAFIFWLITLICLLVVITGTTGGITTSPIWYLFFTIIIGMTVI